MHAFRFWFILLLMMAYITACSTGSPSSPHPSLSQTPSASPNTQVSPTLEATATRTPRPTATLVESIGRTITTIRLPNQGGLFPAAGAGAIWVPAPGLLAKIDPATREVIAEITLDKGRWREGPSAVAVAGNSVWATEPVGFAVVRIDPQSNQIIDRIQLDQVYGELHAITLDGDTLWVALRGINQILRIDTQAKQIVARVAVDDPTSIAIGAGSVWVVEHRKGNLVRIDPNTNSIVATIQLGTGDGSPGQVAFGEGAVWVGEIYGNVVSRVDPETNQEVARIEVDIPVLSVKVGAGAIWAVVGEFEGCQRSGLVRIDTETNTAGGRIPVRCAGDMAISPEGFWVTSYASKELTLVVPEE